MRLAADNLITERRAGCGKLLIAAATLLQVDEATYQRRAAEAAARRDARIVSAEQGLRTLVARLEAGDASAFMALLERVAECLADDGDEDPLRAGCVLCACLEQRIS